jgi:uncharacterized membrane protein YraQ (UPF0718 family)
MIKDILKKIGGGWLFLIAVALLYLGTTFFDTQAAWQGLRIFAKLFIKILPTLAIVFGLLFLSNLLIDTKTVVRHLGKGAKKWAWLIAVIGGIISAGPIYLWYPLLSDLKDKGMRMSLIAVFLYNRAVKIPLLPVMIYYFGVRVVAILTAYMIIFSILNGLIVEKILNINGGNRK